MSDPLGVVEAHLGSIERWSSDVIMDTILEEPNASVIKRVAAFM